MSRGALFSAAVVPILVALGALISVASASGYSTLVFTGEAINVHGYQMTVSARSGPVGPTSLNVDFFRGRPHRSEEDSYQFSKGVSLKTAKDLSRARLAANLGKLGAIDLVVSESRPTTRHKVP